MPKFVSPEEYLQRALHVHGGRYSYSTSTLCSSNAFVPINCPDHGVFQQKLANHLQGAGCPKCAGRGVDWLARFASVHGAKYDYSLFSFVGYKAKAKIVCAIHGMFEQTPDNHYRGKQGCPQCKGARIRASKQMSIEEFVLKAKVVHGERFRYKNKQFTNMLSGAAEIVCPVHGIFKQTPVNHLAGKIGCVKCNNMQSTGEQEVFALVSNYTAAEARNRTVLKPRELDIVLPERSLAIEYSGMYWHSHFDAVEEKGGKHKHIQKYLDCKAQGIRLLTVYEDEWLKHQYALKRLLRNACGKAKGKLMARKCDLRKVATPEARAFYDKYHPQGGAGGGEHYGLYWKEKLVACMRFAFGQNDRGSGAATRVWTLGRYATRLTVAGAASRLFKAFLKEHNPPEVKSFSDNRYFEGGMYEQLGFTLEADVPADYQVWSPKLGLLPKSHYQRRAIPRKLQEHGVTEAFDPATDPRTEAEMTYLMKCGRIYDCGKKKWVYKIQKEE